MIPEEESIDNAFAKFNTIITSLKALDESFSSKNCVRKFLRGDELLGRKEFKKFFKDEESCKDNHEAIEKHFKEVEMMVMIKVKENVLDVVTQIISLENVQSRQRTPIKEHSLEEYGATMEKMRWKRLKIKLAL
ncbi:hypothetical protein Tco_1333572 [Tanacetum coccineum]